MKKTVLRVYDKNDEYANDYKRYFLVLPDNYDDYTIEQNLMRIAGMRWQNYTSWLIGTVDDLEESEMFWSEITDYELKECKIELSRVKEIKRYKLPACMIGE